MPGQKIQDKIEKEFKCEICNKNFSENWILEKHIEYNHKVKDCAAEENVRNKCKICNEKFFHEIGLSYHMDMVHGNMKHKCDYCEKDFNTGDSLKLHFKENHKKFIRCVHKLIHLNTGRGSLIDPYS